MELLTRGSLTSFDIVLSKSSVKNALDINKQLINRPRLSYTSVIDGDVSRLHTPNFVRAFGDADFPLEFL